VGVCLLRAVPAKPLEFIWYSVPFVVFDPHSRPSATVVTRPAGETLVC
jgi:hypothetical protein